MVENGTRDEVVEVLDVDVGDVNVLNDGLVD